MQVFGLSLSAFTTLHVILSLIGIVAGIIVVLGLLANKRLPGWTALFLASTILTSVTGFLFPFSQLLPSHVVGLISLLVLLIAVALYAFRLDGPWRPVYIIAAVVALYFNVFVGVVQAFQKLGFLQGLAPAQSEPPFLVAQPAVLVIFVVLAVLALRSFRPAARGANP